MRNARLSQKERTSLEYTGRQEVRRKSDEMWCPGGGT